MSGVDGGECRLDGECRVDGECRDDGEWVGIELTVSAKLMVSEWV